MAEAITATVLQQGEWFVGSCDQFPEANGQGHSLPDCLRNLADAISLVMEDREHDTSFTERTGLEARKPFVVTPISLGLPHFECTAELLEHMDRLEQFNEKDAH